MRWFPATPPTTTSTRRLSQLGRSRATCRLLVEIKSVPRRQAPIAVRWLPSPPLDALTYPVRSDAVQRIPNPIEFERE
jgi:hypothetical protein